MAAEWRVNSTTATYKNDAGKDVAEITGLKSGLKVKSDGTINGITVVESTSGGTGSIKLASNVLTTSNVTLNLKNNGKYELGFDGYVQPIELAGDVTSDVNSDGTLTLSAYLTEGYVLKDAKHITYTKASESSQKLATITGLNPNLNFNESVKLEDDIITLYDGALNEKDAKLTVNNSNVNYTLALGSDVSAPSVDEDGEWSFTTSKGTTTATYTCDVGTNGYTLSLDDKTVNYTEDGDEIEVFAIKGVSSEVTAETANDYFTVKVISDDTHHYAATVTLSLGALTNKNLSVTKPGYQIVLGEDVQKTETTTNEWFVSDGKTNATATYKTITPEYYTYDESNNTVTYTKQADIKTLATVNNLAKGLVVGVDEETGNSALFTSDEKLAVSVTNSGGVITVQEGALNGGNVTLTNGRDESYSLALGEGITAPGVNSEGLKWTVKGTTATLSGKATAGYAKANDTKITYVAADKSVDFVKVAGLASGVSVPTTGDYAGLVGMKEKNAAGEPIFVQGLSANTYDPEEGGGIITISADVLGTSTATITPAEGYTYSFALDDGTVNANGKAVPTKANTKHFWNVRGSSLLLKDGYANYYTLAEDGTTITQTDEIIGKDVAVVTGLKSGLKINTDGSIDGIEVSGKQITLTSKAVLTQNDVAFSSNSYGYSFAVADSLKPTADSKLWLLDDNTTAVLVKGTTSGYTPQNSGNTLKYSKSSRDETLATITGLKSGLTLDDDWIDGITVGDPEELETEGESGNVVVSNDEEETEGKTITLFKEVLGTTDVVLDSVGLANGYTLAIGSTAKTAVVNPSWSSTTKGKAVYTEKVTTAGFEEKNYEPSEQENQDLAESVYKLAYRKNNITTTISGLKNTLETTALVSALEDVAPNNDGVITLPEEVLGTSTVKISGSPYTLALKDGIEGPVVNGYTWVPDTKNKTKATLTGEVESAGYTVSEDNLSIYYTPAAADTTLATVTGLKSGLTADELAEGISPVGTELVLKSSVLGGTRLTIADGIYTLALDETDENIHTEAESETGWITNGTTATYKSYMSEYYTPNAKGTIISYTKPTAGTTYATVKGIAKGVDISSGFSGNTKGGTIKLNSDMLGASNVTLTGSGFKLALVEEGSGKVLTSSTNAIEWVTSGTTATYKNYRKAYYNLDSNTKITYKAPDKGTTYATITGLASGATITDSNLTKTDNSTIVTLNENQLAGKKVTISGNGYTLALGEISSDSLATSYGKYWTQAANKTDLYYKEDFTPGYYLEADSKSITYSTKDKTVELAKLSNVAKASELVDTRKKLYDDTDDTDNPTKITGYDYTDSAKLDGLTVDDDAKTIAFTSNSLIPNKDADTKKDNAKITLSKTSAYSFVIDEDGDFKEPAVSDEPTWTIVKNTRTDKATGVLTYDQQYTEGVTITDGKTATYSIAKNNTLATISNLNATALDELSDSTVETLATNGISVSGTKILLTSDALLNKSAKKKITLGKNDSFEFDASAIEPTTGVNKWTVKGTTATYNSTLTDGFKETDTKTVSYVKESVDEAIFTLTGLKKGLKVSNDGTKIGAWNSTAKDVTVDGIFIRETTNPMQIELKSAVLGTTNIQLTNNGDKVYKIYDFDGDATTAAQDSWNYSNGTATYKRVQNSGYALDANGLNLTYTAAKTTTLATVKGLKKGFTGILGDVLKIEGEVITVDKDLLDTSTITLTVPKGGTDYSLALASGVAQQAATVPGKWVTTKTKANYQSYKDAYYTVDPQTGKKILYHKPTNVTTYATISGIKNGVDINSASGVTDGKVGGTVTLTADMLTTTPNVTVSVPKANKDANFTLAISGNVPTSSENKTEWVTSGTTAIYKTYNKGSYKVENNKVAYTAGNNPKGSVTEFATIKGASSDITATLSSNTFIISGSELSNNVSVTSAATTAGTSDYAFSFNDDYNNSAITGSGNTDTITAEGDKLTVTGGKGDDEIIFGEDNRVGNLFIYEKNSGNDTIANFKSGDALKISGTINSIAPDTENPDNIVISIGSGNSAGSITLKDCSLETITVNGKDSLTGVSSADLLVDNNYSMDAAKLSSIVEPASVALTPYEYDNSFGLTKEDVFIAATTYAKDK